jgi:hypothetical protein
MTEPAASESVHPISDRPRLIVRGALMLIGRIVTQARLLSGIELEEPAQLVLLPMGGTIGWICIPLPTPNLYLSEVDAVAFADDAMIQQYERQLAEVRAARSGITLPNGPRRSGR